MGRRKTGFAVLPRSARYDERLPPECKVMYSEIVTLSQMRGWCGAANSYFAKLFGVTSRTVQRWIKFLRDDEYIRIEIEEGYKRKIIPLEKILDRNTEEL